MANATGIAIAIVNLGSTGFQFTAIRSPADAFAGSENLTGTWSRDDNTITWGGSNPSFTNSTGTTKNCDRLDVSYPTSGNLGPIAGINHTTVPLEDGDTIVYTSIQISFTTPDPV